MKNQTSRDNSYFITEVTLAGKKYQDRIYMYMPVASAYIQCSWFDDKQKKFMEEGLKAIGQNPTVSLEYSHHPLSHQYKDINVNDHPEVMDNLEWQSSTYLIIFSRKSRDFSHGMDRLTQCPFGRFFFWSALYF